MKLDLNSTSLFADRVNWHIDQALEDERAAEPRRNYLGASVLADPCERQVQYHASGVTPDRTFTGTKLRIFERGHTAEAMAVRWLRMAGFVMLDVDPATGKQFRFSILDGQVAGHADGILLHWLGQDDPPLQLPALWECKCLGSKYFKAAVKDKMRVYSPRYFGQAQLYMGQFKLERCLFTVVNADTMEMHHELIPFDQASYDNLIARAQRVILANQAGEILPRGFDDPSMLACKWCDFSRRCWA